MEKERAASCWRDTGRGERVEWPWGLPGALRGCCGKGRVWDNQRGHRVRGRGGAEGHGGKRQPGAGRGKVVTRIVRVWGLWGKLYLLTCPTRESHFSLAHSRPIASWSPGWRGWPPTKSQVSPFHFGNYFSRRWDIVTGNMLRGML